MQTTMLPLVTDLYIFSVSILLTKFSTVFASLHENLLNEYRGNSYPLFLIASKKLMDDSDVTSLYNFISDVGTGNLLTAYLSREHLIFIF